MRGARFLLAALVALAAAWLHARHDVIDPQPAAGAGGAVSSDLRAAHARNRRSRIRSRRTEAARAANAAGRARRPLRKPSLQRSRLPPARYAQQLRAAAQSDAAPYAAVRRHATPRPRPPASRPTRSTPATSCASWCSARTASPTATSVDAGGNVNLPLIGTVPARGITTQQLSQMIAERLKQGYVREPHVTVEVETYRPFFILGEVTTPGPVSLRRQHDGGERRWRSPAALPRAPTSGTVEADAQRAGPADSAATCR